MYLFKHMVRNIFFLRNHNDTCDILLKKLNEMHLKVLRQNRGKGEILVRCITNWNEIIALPMAGGFGTVFNKLLFKIEQIEEDKTKVDIFIIKNPTFMITLGKDEDRLVDLDKLVSRLLE